MWRPWSETLRAARTAWRWWWRIKATAHIAAPTGPSRLAHTQLPSPSEGWGSPRAPSMWTWGLVSYLNFTASVNCSKGLINTVTITPVCVFSLVCPACMPGACRATGRGLQPSGLRMKQVGDFKVDTKNAGSGDLKVLVKGPSECSSHCKDFTERQTLAAWLKGLWGGSLWFSVKCLINCWCMDVKKLLLNTLRRSNEAGNFTVFLKSYVITDVCLCCVCSEGIEEPVKLISSQDGVFSYEYYPDSPGKYTVTITWGGQHIPKRWAVHSVCVCFKELPQHITSFDLNGWIRRGMKTWSLGLVFSLSPLCRADRLFCSVSVCIVIRDFPNALSSQPDVKRSLIRDCWRRDALMSVSIHNDKMKQTFHKTAMLTAPERGSVIMQNRIMHRHPHRSYRVRKFPQWWSCLQIFGGLRSCAWVGFCFISSSTDS